MPSTLENTLYEAIRKRDHKKVCELVTPRFFPYWYQPYGSSISVNHVHSILQETPLHYAICCHAQLPNNTIRSDLNIETLAKKKIKSSLKIIQTLIKQGANPNKAVSKGTTPIQALFYLVEESESAQTILQCLLDAGADPNYQDRLSDTVLHYAVMCKKPRLLQNLIQQYSKVIFELVNQDKLTASQLSVSTLVNTNAHLADDAKKQTCLFETDDQGHIVLHYTEQYLQQSILETIVQLKSMPIVANEESITQSPSDTIQLSKITPLQLAIQDRQWEIVDILVAAGATLSKYECTLALDILSTKGQTLIMLLAQAGWSETFNDLLKQIPADKKRAYLFKTDKQGNTVLHYAAHYPHPHILATIINELQELPHDTQQDNLLFKLNAAAEYPIDIYLNNTATDRNSDKNRKIIITQTAQQLYTLIRQKQFSQITEILTHLSQQAWLKLANFEFKIEDSSYHANDPTPATLLSELIRHADYVRFDNNRTEDALVLAMEKAPLLIHQRFLENDSSPLGIPATTSLLTWVVQSYHAQKRLSIILRAILNSDPERSENYINSTLKEIEKLSSSKRYQALQSLRSDIHNAKITLQFAQFAFNEAENIADENTKNDLIEKGLQAFKEVTDDDPPSALDAIYALINYYQKTRNHQEAQQWREKYHTQVANHPSLLKEERALHICLASGDFYSRTEHDRASLYPPDLNKAFEHYHTAHSALEVLEVRILVPGEENTIETLRKDVDKKIKSLCRSQVHYHLKMLTEAQENPGDGGSLSMVTKWLNRAHQLGDNAACSLLACFSMIGWDISPNQLSAQTLSHKAKSDSLVARFIQQAECLLPTQPDQEQSKQQKRYRNWQFELNCLMNQYTKSTQKDTQQLSDPYQQDFSALLGYLAVQLHQNPTYFNAETTSRIHSWLALSYHYNLFLTQNLNTALSHYRQIATHNDMAAHQIQCLSQSLSHNIPAETESLTQLSTDIMNWLNTLLAEHHTQLETVQHRQHQHTRHLAQQTEHLTTLIQAQSNLREQLSQITQAHQGEQQQTLTQELLSLSSLDDGTLPTNEPTVMMFYMTVAFKLHQYFKACELVGSDIFELIPNTGASVASCVEHWFYTVRVCGDYFTHFEKCIASLLPNAIFASNGAAVTTGAAAAAGIATGNLWLPLISGSILFLLRMGLSYYKSTEDTKQKKQYEQIAQLIFHHQFDITELVKEIAIGLTKRYEAPLLHCFQSQPKSAQQLGEHVFATLLDIFAQLSDDAAIPLERCTAISSEECIESLCKRLICTYQINRTLPLLGCHISWTEQTVSSDKGTQLAITDFFQKPGIKIPPHNSGELPKYYVGHYTVTCHNKKTKTITIDAATFGYRLSNLKEVKKLKLLETNASNATKHATDEVLGHSTVYIQAKNSQQDVATRTGIASSTKNIPNEPPRSSSNSNTNCYGSILPSPPQQLSEHQNNQEPRNHHQEKLPSKDEAITVNLLKQQLEDLKNDVKDLKAEVNRLKTNFQENQSDTNTVSIATPSNSMG